MPNHYFSMQFPQTRMRRTRAQPFIRNLVRENQLTPKDLILPVFVQEGSQLKTPIASMPEVNRVSIDLLIQLAKQAQDLGIQALALFPVVDSSKKSLDAKEAFNPDGLMQRAIQELKAACPSLGVIGDIALDPYTSHGQDGIIDDTGYILNDITLAVLEQQALAQTHAGVDIVAPSDMMDGRIARIRNILETNQSHNTLILSYAAKYASHFYGPFRDAVGSGSNLGTADKKTYQMDPANGTEAIHESLLDVQEGADILMVKPGMPYLDILWRVKEASQMPTFVYQVSGEYAMLKMAINQGILPETALMEAGVAFKRAGADAILTYSALELAQACYA